MAAADWFSLVFSACFILAMWLLYWSCTHEWKIKNPTYCQGCDQIQPGPSMKWSDIGLYRCSECRREPQLLDQARGVTQKLKNSAMTIAAEWVREDADAAPNVLAQRSSQFSRMNSSIDWRCDQPGEQSRPKCMKRAKFYEWTTGRRYCDRHMKMQPRRQTRLEHLEEMNCPEPCHRCYEAAHIETPDLRWCRRCWSDHEAHTSLAWSPA